MTHQTGIDFEVLLSRLHGGVCAFQSLRAHRRDRGQRGAPPPAPTGEESMVTPPPRAGSVPQVDELVGTRAGRSLEPQAFVAVGGRVVPLFGDLTAGLLDAVAPAPSSMSPPPSNAPQPPPPQDAQPPAPEEARPPVPAAPSGQLAAASTLKLPLPTPPARLGLVHGGHPRPAPEPAPTASPSATAPQAVEAPKQPVSTPAPRAEEVPSAASITALLAARAEEEALRLESIHADHRAAIATLLREHRDELRAQREADAASTTLVLRELLAEHRAELTRVAETHAEQLAQVLGRHQQTVEDQLNTEEHPTSDLRSALLEQASLQREAHEDVAEHIAALTTIVADLGQTVGMLAVAAAQGAHPVRFAPPPRPTPTSPASTAAPAPPAASQADSATAQPAATAASSERARASPCAPPPPYSSAAAPTKIATDARDRARVLQCVDDDRDDDDLDMPTDEEGTTARSRLAPVTPLDPAPDRECGDG